MEKLVYTNEKGESLELGTGFLFHCNISKDVSGMSDVRNTVYRSNSMGQHGDTYVGQRIEPKEITATGLIREKDKYLAADARRNAVKILNPDLHGELRYILDDFERVISCRVEGSPEFFKKKVLYGYEFNFLCLDPFWRKPEETKKDIAGWFGGLEFPVSIERDDPDDMMFASRSESIIVDCYNEGDVSTGMRIRFTAIGTVNKPVLLNIDTQEFIKVNTTMLPGDVIEINTEYGSKGAVMIRADTESNYFRHIDVDSTFMQLSIGDNTFRYDAESGVDQLEVSIFYSAKYLGV